MKGMPTARSDCSHTNNSSPWPHPILPFPITTKAITSCQDSSNWVELFFSSIGAVTKQNITMPYRRVRNSCSAREGHVALAFSSTKWMVHQLQPQELTGRVGCLGPNTADGKKTVEHTMLSKRTSKCPQKPTSCTQAGSTQCSLFPSKPPHDSVSLCNLCVFTHSCIFSIKIPHSLPLAHFHVRWSGDASLLTYFLLSTIDFF